MDEREIKKIVNDIKSGNMSDKEAVEMLKTLPYQDFGFAKIDHHRAIRKGYPEVIYGKDKTADQIVKIAAAIYKNNKKVLVTRISPEKYEKIKKDIPFHNYNETGRIIRVGKKPKAVSVKTVPVITGGTADLPVAEEAAFTLEAMGNKVEKIYDVGVSGVHRLLSHMDKIKKSSVIIAIAGMDGVLPTLVGGLASQLVIAVPTSRGYGVSFNGIGPLITMLNSCAPGVVVVNIDGGFGAAYAASQINKL